MFHQNHLANDNQPLHNGNRERRVKNVAISDSMVFLAVHFSLPCIVNLAILFPLLVFLVSYPPTVRDMELVDSYLLDCL